MPVFRLKRSRTALRGFIIAVILGAGCLLAQRAVLAGQGSEPVDSRIDQPLEDAAAISEAPVRKPLPAKPETDLPADPAVASIDGVVHSTYAVAVSGKVYVAAQNEVVVLSQKTNAILAEIPMQTGLYLGVLGDKVYVPYNDSVKVIDTATDRAIATISVPAGATTITPSGVKLYVTCGSANAVAVIDTRTNTVSSVIPVGERPFYGSVLGEKVYISNNSKDNGSLSVIDTASDQVEATIPLGAEPVLQAFVGTKLYVSNKISNTVSVIDTVSNQLLTTISVGADPEMLLPYGDKLYLVNRSSDSVMVIDPATDTVIKEIPVGSGPYYLIASGQKIFVGNHGADTVSVIDPATDTVSRTLTVGSTPFYLMATSDKIYVPNAESDFMSIITISEVNLPELVSFETSAGDGFYPAGKRIDISARFNRLLAEGSSMLIKLNTGAKIKLSQVSGQSLSGTYIVGDKDEAPDLAVTAVLSAWVSDRDGHARRAYSIPYSAGTFAGENSLIARNLGDSHNIAIGKFARIDVGANPYQISSAFTANGRKYAYVANQGGESLSVVDLAARKEIGRITVGSEPYGFASPNISGVARFYVANTNSHSVSVVNAALNQVVQTLQVGLKPYYAAAINAMVFVTNGQSNTVSVINTLTNAVIATVPVGAYPRGIKATATEMFVANYGDPYYYSGGNTVSVIDGFTNQVTHTIVLPAGCRGPRGVAVSGNRVYVTNYLSNNVAVIDSWTKQVIAVIPVGAGPRGMAVANGKLYVENFDDGTLSVINTASNQVVKTVMVGHSPSGITAIDNLVYISNFQDNNLLLLDPKSDALLRSSDISPFTGEDAEQPVGVSADKPEPAAEAADKIAETAPVQPSGEAADLNIGNASLYQRLKGSIVIKAEGKGEAYYISPSAKQAYTLGQPAAAQRILRQQSTGITAANLARIPVGIQAAIGADSDHDGLSDRQEQALGSDPAQADSDHDGYDDRTELAAGYNPLGWGRLPLDSRFARQQAGRIFLDVENRGEAWYVNPRDGKRYFLGAPEDALAALRQTAMGISSRDFAALR